MSSRKSKLRSNAPTGTKATNAEGNAESNAAAVILDATATPPGSSVPGGTNTPESDSGAAAGSAPADQVKPQDQDGTSTPVTETDATNGQSAPDAEAAASGDNEALRLSLGGAGILPPDDHASSNEPSQGAADAGTGDTAGSGDQALTSGVDLASGPDVGMIAWGSYAGGLLVAATDAHPLAHAFLAAELAGRPNNFVATLRVAAKTRSVRRGGMRHSKEGLDFLPGEITAEQLEAFLGDPNLTVELV